MILGKYSFGIGDRFGHQGKAQLAAILQAQEQGLEITPVWNKSNREHTIIGTSPADVRREADAAIAACGWKKPYYVDADHIGLTNVDAFLSTSDFFTLDVADFIGRPAPEADIQAFVKKHKDLLGSHQVKGIDARIVIDEARLRSIAAKYLVALQQAGNTFRHIEARKDLSRFVTEVSMDETDTPQTPVDLLVILAALADEGIPAQTIAPKFSGRFNKGVDYVGDVSRFAREFEEDLAVIRFAVERFGLPGDLKLSVHSGSDKFSIYRPIHRALKQFNAGVHVKTAGTTWLEELIGLALAGGDGLAIAKDIYAQALSRLDELCGPYATVIDIDKTKLPDPDQVRRWDSAQFAAALRHDRRCPQYNPSLRQLLHVGYKVAAELGPRFTEALDKHEAIIAENVTANLYERHIRPLFLEDKR
ncbi:MAG: tagaturonate epimerase family protein [Planctomycetes bacterium]|nr:tagaturonate epimerase family protein [Planctomycetota bacterium]